MAKRYKGKQARKQPREAAREPRANAKTVRQAAIGEAAENYPIYASMWGRTGVLVRCHAAGWDDDFRLLLRFFTPNLSRWTILSSAAAA